MKSGWWSGVLVLLCLPAQVTPNSQTVFQNPSSTSVVRVNSSLEITCSTLLSEPMGLYLVRGVQGTKQLLYLSLQDGKINKETITEEFKGRVVAGVEKQTAQSYSISLSLSLLQLRDTNLYYCSWNHLDTQLEVKTLNSKGTIVIVTEEPNVCVPNILDFILMSFSALAFTFVLLISAGILILRCRRFKTDFRPARAVKTTRANRPVHVCPHRRAQNSPYLETSENTLDFSRIL